MWEQEFNVAIDLVKKASVEIMNIYKTAFEVEIKDDNSPVTSADKLADNLLKTGLKKQFPSHFFLTEESYDDKLRLSHDYVWIIDPIDGTKDFVKRDGMFTINVALSYEHKPVLGIIMIPVTGDIYYAILGKGSFHIFPNGSVKKIHVNDKLENLTMLTSVFHTTEEEIKLYENNREHIVNIEKIGSSIKACKIAEGSAEVSFRLGGGTKEWDTCASQIIVEQAGGKFIKPSGEEIRYNREDVYNREGFVILNRPENNFCK